MLNAAQRALPSSTRDAAAVLGRPVLASSLAETVRGALAQLRGESAEAPPAPPALRLRGVRILLAEDNALNQLIARGMLEPLGAELTVANNGQEAVDLLHADPQRADVVLMDVQMPVMDGYEATRRIRAMGLPLPVLAMSAGVMESERAECEAAGMNGFIAKPVEYEQMLEAIIRSIDPARRPS
jgi:CheY-like chemotaxis protein